MPQDPRESDLVRPDRINVVKQNGQKLENIRAAVKSSYVGVGDVQPRIEDGDTIERIFPDGFVEEYTVLNSGYESGVAGLPGQYKCKVRKKTAIREQTEPHVVYNLGDISISGPNARLNLHSQDMSSNIVDLNADELFEKLNDAIAEGVEDDEKRLQLQSKVAGLRKTQGTSEFNERYKEFIAVVADHLTLISPFIPALTQLL